MVVGLASGFDSTLSDCGENLFGNCPESFIGGGSQFAGQQGRKLEHVFPSDFMPNRENDFAPLHLACKQTVEFGLGPVLGKETPGQNDDAVFGSCQPFVNLLAKAVADMQSPFVIPDANAETGEFSSKVAHKIIFIFAGVGDENVEAHGRDRRRSVGRPDRASDVVCAGVRSGYNPGQQPKVSWNA